MVSKSSIFSGGRKFYVEAPIPSVVFPLLFVPVELPLSHLAGVTLIVSGVQQLLGFGFSFPLPPLPLAGFKHALLFL